jgi:hypothetical protein
MPNRSSAPVAAGLLKACWAPGNVIRSKRARACCIRLGHLSARHRRGWSACARLGWLFRLGEAIPIAPYKEDPVAHEQAFAQARQVLDAGELLCIFPEGAITRDGSLGEFKGGVMKILHTHPVPVLPLALRNLWGSFFSRVEGGTAMARPFRRGWFSTVGLVAGPALPAAEVSPAALRERVADLLAA